MSDGELIRQVGELTIPQLKNRMDELREVMKSVMIADTDYGVIPGTKGKPTLLKPGAEKLSLMFRYAPKFEEEIIQLPNNHREYRMKCVLIHVPTGAFVGEASSTC